MAKTKFFFFNALFISFRKYLLFFHKVWSYNANLNFNRTVSPGISYSLQIEIQFNNMCVPKVLTKFRTNKISN